MIEIKYMIFKAFKKIAFIKILYFFLGWFRPRDSILKNHEITDLVDNIGSNFLFYVLSCVFRLFFRVG